ncbi:MAG: OmpH family outer membrane protein [Chitinophagaceae bacterium]
MKNGLVIWNVLLTIIAGYLLFAQLNKKENNSKGSKRSVTDSLSATSPFRIAYFEMDSVQNNTSLVKDVQAEIEKKEKEFSTQLSQLQYSYESKIQEYQQKEKAGTMTQADYEKAQTDVRQLENRIKNRKQEMDQQYQEFMMRSQLNLKKTIENFIADYNKSKTYSYIVAYEQGLFYYKDTIYDITEDVVKGLNELYKKKKK